MRKIRTAFLIVLILVVTLTGCGAEQVSDTADFFAMDTYMRITVYGDGADELTRQAEEEIMRIENVLSFSGDGEIGTINEHGGGTVSEETQELLERALELSRDTGGAFDITIYPVVEAWGFFSGEYRVPGDSELSDLLGLTGWEKVSVVDGQVSFQVPDMGIDLGGIGKGYAGQRVHDMLWEAGISSALLELGGNVCLLGGRPDGTAWRVGIMSPTDGEEYVGILEARDVSIVTSGGYQRYFEEDGVRYHHIIDPATGYPADSGLLSVTIVCDDGARADALSTALFVMGEEEAVSYWAARDDFDFILVTQDGRVVITPGLREDFQVSEGYDLEVAA